MSLLNPATGQPWSPARFPGQAARNSRMMPMMQLLKRMGAMQGGGRFGGYGEGPGYQRGGRGGTRQDRYDEWLAERERYNRAELEDGQPMTRAVHTPAENRENERLMNAPGYGREFRRGGRGRAGRGRYSREGGGTVVGGQYGTSIQDALKQRIMEMQPGGGEYGGRNAQQQNWLESLRNYFQQRFRPAQQNMQSMDAPQQNMQPMPAPQPAQQPQPYGVGPGYDPLSGMRISQPAQQAQQPMQPAQQNMQAMQPAQQSQNQFRTMGNITPPNRRPMQMGMQQMQAH